MHNKYSASSVKTQFTLVLYRFFRQRDQPHFFFLITTRDHLLVVCCLWSWAHALQWAFDAVSRKGVWRFRVGVVGVTPSRVWNTYVYAPQIVAAARACGCREDVLIGYTSLWLPNLTRCSTTSLFALSHNSHICHSFSNLPLRAEMKREKPLMRSLVCMPLQERSFGKAKMYTLYIVFKAKRQFSMDVRTSSGKQRCYCKCLVLITSDRQSNPCISRTVCLSMPNVNGEAILMKTKYTEEHKWCHEMM